MYKFSKRSKENLSQAHEDLQVLFNEVIKCRDCSVICGYRGEKEQNEAFDNGKSLLKYPNSKHNKIPSLAVDIVPYPIAWDDIKRFEEFGDFVLKKAESLKKEGRINGKIIWGGNWKKFKDYPHYELS